jgi:uncharacterized protein (TIGR02145 family)
MKIRYKTLLIAVLLNTAPLLLFAQNLGINDDGSSPNSSAMLDVKSTTKGLLIPRMTAAQIGAIVNPPDGLQAYNTYDGKIYVFVSLANVWKELSYGADTINPPSFVCGNLFVDARDGKMYSTVLIGTQCWMRQNINIGQRIIIGYGGQTNNNIIEKYCYADLELNCDVYGGLYLWDESMQYSTTEGVQGICPTGWHFPTDAEWSTLTTYLGGESVAGGKLKETGIAHWCSPNIGATNESGFTALPGGWLSYQEDFGWVGVIGCWWSSSEYYSNTSFGRLINCSYSNVERTAGYKSYGHSIRCIRD